MAIFKTLTKQLLLNTKLSLFLVSILNKKSVCLNNSSCKQIILILEKLEDENRLLKSGYIYNSMKDIVLLTKKTKIAYVLNNSLSLSNNGYSLRSHHILKTIQSINMDIYAVTRVGFPWDLKTKTEFTDTKERYDEVSYFRLDKEGFRLHDTVPSRYIDNYIEMLIDFMQKNKISIAHGASDYLTGLATVGAARALNIPSIYEVRGFWEITRASRESFFKHSVSFKMMKKLEIQACNDATTVIALSEVVKEELLLRGVDEQKIYVLPNDVNTSKLQPLIKNTSMVQNLNLENKFVIGFIGSVVDYEGLKLLVEAASTIEKLHVNSFRYLIVGDGNDLENLKMEVNKMSLNHLFIFTGRVPHTQVEKYYSVLDAACYPRLDWEVCRIVSPKKPFEAMAYGIPVISSSVRANSYFIEDGINGLLHQAGNSDDLATKILAVYSDGALRQRLSEGGRDWVVKHRGSSQTAILLKKIYQETQEKFYR